jgi:hypothetical protein
MDMDNIQLKKGIPLNFCERHDPMAQCEGATAENMGRQTLMLLECSGQV